MKRACWRQRHHGIRARPGGGSHDESTTNLIERTSSAPLTNEFLFSFLAYITMTMMLGCVPLWWLLALLCMLHSLVHAERSSSTARVSGNPSAVQYVWSLHELALATYDRELIRRLGTIVAKDMMQLTRHSADPRLSECYGRPKAAMAAMDIVTSAGLSSGFSRDLVELKKLWEGLTSRRVLGASERARRVLVGRLLVHGFAVADQVLAEAGRAKVGKDANGTRTAVIESIAVRPLQAVAAVSNALSSYLSTCMDVQQAAVEAQRGASVVHRRVNVAVGLCIGQEAGEEAQEAAQVDARGDQPGLDTVSSRVAPTLNLSTVPNDTQPLHGEGREAGVDRLHRMQMQEAMRAAEKLADTIDSVAAAALPRSVVLPACALAGVLSRWLSPQGQTAHARLCGCTDSQGPVQGVCSPIVNGTMSWLYDHGPGLQGRLFAHPSSVLWDCCWPADSTMQGGDTHGPLYWRVTGTTGLASCSLLDMDACSRQESTNGGDAQAAQGSLDADTPPSLHAGTFHVAMEVQRALAALKVAYQADDAQAIAGPRV